MGRNAHFAHCCPLCSLAGKQAYIRHAKTRYPAMLLSHSEYRPRNWHAKHRSGGNDGACRKLAITRLVLVLLRWQWFVDTIIVITLIAKMAFKYHKNECNFILTLVNLLSLRGFVKRFHGISWFPLIYLFAFPGIL